MQDYTKGPIVKPSILLALPLLGGLIIQQTYQLVDIYWISQLGKEAVAAISSVIPIFLFIHYVGVTLMMVANILISQLLGKNEKEKLKDVTTQSITLSLILGTIIALIGYIFSPYFLSALKLEDQVYHYAYTYVALLIFSIPFKLFFMTFEGLFRGIGEVKLPFYIITLSGFINIVLDPIFIFYFNMGILGAALATFLVELISASVGAYFLLKHPYLTLNFPFITIVYIKTFLNLGLPNSIENIVPPIVNTALVSITATFGTAALAAYGIGLKVSTLAAHPNIAYGEGIITMIGQNKGANNHSRIKEITIKSIIVALVLSSLMGILTWILAPTLMQLFSSDQKVIEYGTDFIRILILGWAFFAINKTLYGVAKGLGDTVSPMIIYIISLLLGRVGFAYLLAPILGFLAIAWAFTISDAIATLLALILIGRKIWWLDLKGSSKKA